jgi:hypothetical protein
MERLRTSPGLAVALLAAAALLLWQLVLRPRNTVSEFSEKDLPPAMRLDPRAPTPPVTGPVPERPTAPR